MELILLECTVPWPHPIFPREASLQTRSFGSVFVIKAFRYETTHVSVKLGNKAGKQPKVIKKRLVTFCTFSVSL